MVLIRKIIAALLAFLQSILAALGIIAQKPAPASVDVFEKGISDVVMADSSSNLSASVEYAQSIKNGVQCAYGDSDRSSYIISNGNIRLEHELTDIEKYATLSDKNGNAYIENSFKSFYADALGVKHYFETSFSNARVNTIRLGAYYYDVHVRDMDSGNFYIDKGFHVYPDKLYMEYSMLAKLPTKTFSAVGSEITIPADSVSAIEIKDKNGVSSSVKDIDAASVEYAAFDINGVGVVGFIIPSDGSTGKTEIKKTAEGYVITQTACADKNTGLNKYDETGDYELNKISFGCRIYTDDTHSFDGISKAAYEERNPLKISVTGGNANPVYLGYEALRGTYTFGLDGVGFVAAYNDPHRQYSGKLRIEGGESDRKIIIRSYVSNSGCLEAGAVLDDNDLLMPIDVQACKNFMGDGGEPVYSVKDYCYGDCFIPIVAEKEKNTDLTVLNIYQNWGKYPIKQISSIEFHVSYYHLSTGTTESNCIAPYFVFGKDGWTLPDFRNRSGNIWSTQPQFNSVGILKFMSYRDPVYDGTVYSEFRGSEIASRGFAYSDVTDYYTADSGKYDYSLRHVEFPQTDENRTYYTLKVDFKDTVTFENFKKDFDIFYFDGRFVNFKNTGYLGENNQPVNAPVSGGTAYHTLGSENPYFGYYTVTDETEHYIDECFGCNFALIVKDSKIVVGGRESNIPFVFREGVDAENTGGCLTLDAEKLTFEPGDSIEMNVILLPWGTGRETNDSNVLTVREDSALKPVEITAQTGSVAADAYLPEVKAVNNTAEFTVKGGRGNIAVRADGFDSMKAPEIYTLSDGGWVKYELASENGYDGYTVHSNDDGTYSFSFVYTSDGPDCEYSFRITQ